MNKSVRRLSTGLSLDCSGLQGGAGRVPLHRPERGLHIPAGARGGARQTGARLLRAQPRLPRARHRAVPARLARPGQQAGQPQQRQHGVGQPG